MDTITLRFHELQFKVIAPEKFNPDVTHFFEPPFIRMGGRGYIDAVQNGTRKEMLEGIYKPQLTIRKRWLKNRPANFLYVQFSGPKLINGNNFDELNGTEIDEISERLREQLFKMGVVIKQGSVKFAQVVKIHYSKNIILPEYIIPSMIIGELAKVDFDLRYDITEKDYRNGGSSLRFHIKDFEFILYDKKKDLERARTSSSKRIDFDNAIQLNLFDTIKQKKALEILRLEVRLNSTQKIKQVLKLESGKHNLQELLSRRYNQSVLTECWSNLLNKYKIQTSETSEPEKFLSGFFVDNPKSKLQTAMWVHDFITISKQIGERKLRELIERKYSKRTWNSIKAQIRNLNIDSKVPNYFDFVTKTIEYCIPTHFSEIENLL